MMGRRRKAWIAPAVCCDPKPDDGLVMAAVELYHTDSIHFKAISSRVNLASATSTRNCTSTKEEMSQSLTLLRQEITLKLEVAPAIRSRGNSSLHVPERMGTFLTVEVRWGWNALVLAGHSPHPRVFETGFACDY